MSFNHSSDLVGQNMRSVHFKKGQVVYNEDDDGDFMYFINSGTIEVSTRDEFLAKNRARVIPLAKETYWAESAELPSLYHTSQFTTN